ncbi:MAG: 30S ribosomal protein S6 [Candidatus Neomarinimicrobiota bacterium]
MSFYETLYILDPNLENNTLDKTMDDIGQELIKTKSKIINHRIWGKKRLAYPIDRQKYGSYIILQFEGSGDQDKMNDYDAWMRLSNSVLRHITVLLNEKPELYVDDINSNQDKLENKKEEGEAGTSDSEPNNDKDSSLNEENSESKEVE